MLTELELRVLDFVYSILSKSPALPINWKNKELSLKTNGSRVFNFSTWILVLPVLGYKLAQLPELIRRKDLNGTILHSFFLIGAMGNAVQSLSIWIYKSDLVYLVNQVLSVNAQWGM